jgi:membrane-bound lytic murein transglycosylase D
MVNLRRLLRIPCAALALAGAAAFAAAPPPAAHSSLPEAFDDADVPLPDPDLWQRIRLGFTLEAMESPLVLENEQWYANRPDYIKRFVDRGSRYLHYIVEQVEKRGMPTEIALLPVVESAFTPRAMSRSKASGLWQFIPSTGKNFGLTQDWWRDNRNDVVASTDAALDYLQRLYDMFGSWELALAAYNCGEGCVSRAIAYNQKRGLPTDYLSLGRLPNETRNYVPRLIAVKNIVLAPTSYGIELDSVPDQPYFTAVDAPKKIDVRVAAKLAGMSVDDFVALNPAHNKPVAVTPTGTLIVPVDKADTFRENLENYDQPLVSWTTYAAKRGESVDAIARRYGVSPAQLRTVNDKFKLDKKGRLRVAQQVLVPMQAAHKAAPVQVAQAENIVAADSPGESAVKRVSSSVRWYTVRAGDTLFSIARRANTALDTILHLNNLAPTAILRPGLKLRLQ